MTIWAVTLAAVSLVVLPLVLNEAGEVAPWLASRMVTWAAHRLPPGQDQNRYAEEWVANLEYVPGRLTKLMWALGILVVATPRLRWRLRRIRRVDGLVHRFEVDEVISLVTGRFPRGLGGIHATAVIGRGGDGKSAVARMVKADAAIGRRFRGGVFWIDCGQITEPDEVTHEILCAVDRRQRYSLTSPDQRLQLLRRMSQKGRRRLIILDDVGDPDLIHQFADLSDRWHLLVTSRIAPAVAGLTCYRLGDLNVPAAREILTANLPGFPPDIAEHLVAACERNPLALRLASARISRQCRKGVPVAEVAEDLLRRLRQASDSHAELDRAVETATNNVVASLSADAQRAFLDIATFLPGTVSFQAAYRLWSSAEKPGTTWEDFLSAIGEIADASLFRCDGTATPAVIHVPDLLHAYAARRLDPQRRARLQDIVRDLTVEHPPHS